MCHCHLNNLLYFCPCDMRTGQNAMYWMITTLPLLLHLLIHCTVLFLFSAKIKLLSPKIKLLLAHIQLLTLSHSCYFLCFLKFLICQITQICFFSLSFADAWVCQSYVCMYVYIYLCMHLKDCTFGKVLKGKI